MKLNFKFLAFSVIIFVANVKATQNSRDVSWSALSNQFPNLNLVNKISCYLYLNTWSKKIKPHPVATGIAVSAAISLPIIIKLYKKRKLDFIINKAKKIAKDTGLFKV